MQKFYKLLVKRNFNVTQRLSLLWVSAALVSAEAIADVSIDAVAREYSQVTEVEREQSWMSYLNDWYKSEELNSVRYAKCDDRFRWPCVLGDIIQAVRDKILA